MNIHDLRQTPHWSYSALNCYLMCPLKYKFQYVDKAQQEHTSSCFPFGRAYHAVLSQRALNGGSLSVSDAGELFAVCFKAETMAAENLRYKPGESYESLLNTGLNMISAALDNWQDDFSVKSVAEGFSVNIPGLSKPLIGEWDCVVQNGREVCIVDWKTSASRWPANKADRDLQATVFLYAYEKLNGQAASFRFDVTTKAKTPVCESHYTGRTLGDFRRLEALALNIDAAVRQRVFYPNESSLSCANCPYAKRCREWKGEDYE